MKWSHNVKIVFVVFLGVLTSLVQGAEFAAGLNDVVAKNSSDLITSLNSSLKENAGLSPVHQAAFKDIRDFHGDVVKLRGPSIKEEQTASKTLDKQASQAYNMGTEKGKRLAQAYTRRRDLTSSLFDNQRKLQYLQQLKSRISEWPKGNSTRNVLEQSVVAKFGDLDTAINRLTLKDAQLQGQLKENELFDINTNK